MTTITVQQARKRYQTLKPILQDAIFSVQTAEIIRKVCEQNNLPEEKIPFVAGKVGLVLLGFIHPEELADEIREGAEGIAPQLAKTISDSLANRLFNPLREELEEAYAPAPHEEEIAAAPKIIEEIKMPAKTLEAMVTKAPQPTPGVTKQPEAPPKKEIIGEFERLAAEKKQPGEPLQPIETPYGKQAQGESPAVSRVEPPAAIRVEPPPTILHEEPKSAAPPPSVSSFRVNIPPPPKMPATEKAPPPRPAVTEFGIKTTPPPPPPKIPRSEIFGGRPPEAPKPAPETKPIGGSREKPPRVVHYIGLKTPLEPQPEKNVPPQPTQQAKLSQPELPPGENIKKEDAASKSTPPKPAAKPPAPPALN
jgi:hypothetical protein